jgi:hypothetical protein
VHAGDTGSQAAATQMQADSNVWEQHSDAGSAGEFWGFLFGLFVIGIICQRLRGYASFLVIYL